MLDPKIEKRFLSWLYDNYCHRYGYGIRNIDNCDFLTTYSCAHLPVEFYEVNNGVQESLVIHYAKELQAKGPLKFDENGYQFYFTEKGYNTVSKSICQRVLDTLNKNPGVWAALAIIISIGSLIVSILGVGQ